MSPRASDDADGSKSVGRWPVSSPRRPIERQQYGQCRLGVICGGTERIESEGRHAGGCADALLTRLVGGKPASKNRIDQ